jgi:small GTP-binding protein
MLLDGYRERKAQVRYELEQLAELAGQLGMASVRREISDTWLPKFDEERFNLVVLGEFNHGKSTFVNALLGKALLPVGITPTTATINHIVWSDNPRARVIKRDASAQDIEPEQLADFVTIEGEQSSEVQYVELGYPAPLLRDRITLVDTPGVNDINEARAEITYSYIPSADAVIFLLDSTQVLKQSERIFIQQRLLRRSRDKLLFVLGKIDLLDDEERAQAIAFAREHLSALVPDPVVFPLSPRQYLAGQIEQSGMLPLLEYLRVYLTEQRVEVLLDNGIADAQRTLRYLSSSVDIKRGTLDLSLQELDERVSGVRNRLEGSRQSLRKLEQRIASEGAAIKATVRHDLRLFSEEFCRVLPAQIEQADASDIKRYLQFFIQDKFKEWAELEGDKIARMLEQLAEEIIEVTNQSVDEAMRMVADRLGEARLDLEIDTLRYDAGIFALGALGTTVFLFVNAFVGGLLTLAAPVLAVVLQERMAGQVKRQAKQKAPEAISSAAETMRPRFEQIVDEFVKRLGEFVSSAGDTLYRGISEVLDQALAERREQGRDASQVREGMEQIRQQLERQGERLEQLREGVWSEQLPTP